MIIAIFDVEENIVKREKCFLTTILTFFYNVFKNLPFLDCQKSACLVLKLTREVSISSLAKMFLTIILSFLYNVFKNLPFLDCQNSGLFGTKTYTRGIDFLLSKNAFKHHHSLLPLQCFQKTFHFWIVKTRDCLVLKLTREVSISSSAKKATTLIMPVWSVWSKTCFQ